MSNEAKERVTVQGLGHHGLIPTWSSLSPPNEVTD